MNMAEVLARLQQDNPRFHELSEVHARQSAVAGYVMSPGDVSLAVPPLILRWIGNHVRDDMITIETGAGHTTVLLAALAQHHYCCTYQPGEEKKIRAYMNKLGIRDDKVTFAIGSTAQTLPRLQLGSVVDFAYIDGCHGYPFPALDWHYIDQWVKVGGMVGMDNVELRPVRDHCEFLEENGSYRLAARVYAGYFVRFYEKLRNEDREWIYQAYSRAKRDPCDWSLRTRVKRKATKLIKPYLF